MFQMGIRYQRKTSMYNSWTKRITILRRYVPRPVIITVVCFKVSLSALVRESNFLLNVRIRIPSTLDKLIYILYHLYLQWNIFNNAISSE